MAMMISSWPGWANDLARQTAYLKQSFRRVIGLSQHICVRHFNALSLFLLLWLPFFFCPYFFFQSYLTTYIQYLFFFVLFFFLYVMCAIAMELTSFEILTDLQHPRSSWTHISHTHTLICIHTLSMYTHNIRCLVLVSLVIRRLSILHLGSRIFPNVGTMLVKYVLRYAGLSLQIEICN